MQERGSQILFKKIKEVNFIPSFKKADYENANEIEQQLFNETKTNDQSRVAAEEEYADGDVAAAALL